MTYLPFPVFSFQFSENSLSLVLLSAIPSQQWDGLPWPPSVSLYKQQAVLFNILFLFQTPPLETLSYKSSAY